MRLLARSLLVILAGCGARSHDPFQEIDDLDAAPAAEEAVEPEPAAPGPPDAGTPSDPPRVCDPTVSCCRDRECDEGQVCGECPQCAGGRQCGWPMNAECAGELRGLIPQPNVMLLLDRSESMEQPIERTRKWDLVRDALSTVLPELHPYYRFGLTSFPADHGNCGAPEVELEPAEGQTEEILDVLAASEPLLATPLGDALSAMADDQALSDPDRAQVVLLLSDGGESCGVDPVQPAERLRDEAPRVDLYVLSIGDAHGLDDVAWAAGTGAAMSSSSTVTGLADALRQVLDRAAPCRVALGDLRGDVEPSVYDEAGALVPHDPTGRVGWRLGSEGETLELHGETCGTWRNGAPLTIVWPCGP